MDLADETLERIVGGLAHSPALVEERALNCEDRGKMRRAESGSKEDEGVLL